jgi:coatomer subunit beta'
MHAVCSVKFIARKQWFICATETEGFAHVYSYETEEMQKVNSFRAQEMQKVNSFRADDDHIRPISLAVHPSQPYVMSWYYGNETMKLWNWDKGWECTRTFQISGKTFKKIAFDPKETNRFAATAVGTSFFDTDVDVMVRLSILC